MNSSGYREGQTMHKVDCDLWIEQHKDGQRENTGERESNFGKQKDL